MDQRSPTVIPLTQSKSSTRPTILLTCYMTGAADGKNLGVAGYSYDIVAQLFTRLLQRWGDVAFVPEPHKNLDQAAQQVLQEGGLPVHVSFLPFQDVYLAKSARNIVVPAWEFPDVPNEAFDNNPCNSWPTMADQCSTIIVGGQFTVDALRRGGTNAPINIVPVPTPNAYFHLEPWQPDGESKLICRSYSYPTMVDEEPRQDKHETGHSRRGRDTVPQQKKQRIGRTIEKAISSTFRRLITFDTYERISRTIHAGKDAWKQPLPLKNDAVDKEEAVLKLSGVVYSTVLNPIDGRKNWQELLNGFLLALRDQEDATLVIKLIRDDPMTVYRVLRYYKRIDIPHRCKVLFVTGFLSDEQMLQLCNSSTYYLQTTRAEGNCLPLMNYMAAGRPGITPVHTAISDYFDKRHGFQVETHPVPTPWPHDKRQCIRTTWSRLVFPSLIEQLQKSYEIAKNDRNTYDALSAAAREKMLNWSSEDAVWRKLKPALDYSLTQPVNPADFDAAVAKAAA